MTADFEDPLYSATQDSSLWTAYSYAVAQHPTHPEEESFALAALENQTGDTANLAPAQVGHGQAVGCAIDPFGYYEETGDGLGLDTYLEPATLLVQPDAPSYLHPRSPGLPPLSSADSTPSASSALHTPYGPFDANPPAPTAGSSGLLLPSAPIPETGSSSRFAQLQESYLEHQQQILDYREREEGEPPFPRNENVVAVEPTSHALAFSTSAPPLTPSRRTANRPPSAQLWRSPSSHSVHSSPSKSPYASSRTKPYDRPPGSSPTKEFDSPTKTIVRRPFPTSHNDLLLSPTKGGGRRQRANLSIDVPSTGGLRSRLPVIAASPQVPSTDGKFPGGHASLDSGSDLTESTLEQVENLLQEFGPMARSGTFDSASSSSQSSASLSSFGHSRGPSSSGSSDTRYCISGVALSLEDMAQLDDPSLTAAFDSVTMQHYPASAPSHQTTFNLPEPPSPSPYHLHIPNSLHTTPEPTSQASYVHESAHTSQPPVFERWSPSSYVAARGSNAPFGAHVRSISAPRTAYYPSESELAQLPMQPPISHSLATSYSTHSLPAHSSPAGPTIRRRSSVASGSPSTSSPWSQGPPRPQQVFHSHSYGPPPVSYAAQYSPYHNVPLPLRPAPPPGSTFDVSPPASPTKQKPKAKATLSNIPASPTKSVPTSPKKRKGGPRARNPSAMFVNFSAADAKKLLSGVAPSGSSKKKREEEEAAMAAAKLAPTNEQPEHPSATQSETPAERPVPASTS